MRSRKANVNLSVIAGRLAASLLLLAMVSCSYSHSDPCQSSVYEECMERTENTTLADIVCSEKAVSECGD